MVHKIKSVIFMPMKIVLDFVYDYRVFLPIFVSLLFVIVNKGITIMLHIFANKIIRIFDKSSQLNQFCPLHLWAKLVNHLSPPTDMKESKGRYLIAPTRM